MTERVALLLWRCIGKHVPRVRMEHVTWSQVDHVWRTSWRCLDWEHEHRPRRQQEGLQPQLC